MKNPNDPIGNRYRDHQACSAVPQPTAAQPAPPPPPPDLVYELLLRKICWTNVKWPARLWKSEL